MTKLESLKERLKHVMLVASLTREDLMELTATQREQVNRWLRGASKPPAHKLKLISERAGFNMLWVQTGQGEMRPHATARQENPHNSVQESPVALSGQMSATSYDKESLRTYLDSLSEDPLGGSSMLKPESRPQVEDMSSGDIVRFVTMLSSSLDEVSGVSIRVFNVVEVRKSTSDPRPNTEPPLDK